MRPLSDTIARLSALRAQQKAAERSAAPQAGRLSDLRGFGSNPGALAAKSYVPDNLADGAALVVVLHGCTQTAAGYDLGAGWSRLADRAGFALLFPEQVRANNANLCFNWFLPDDTRRGSGEALSIRQMIESFAARRGIDPARIFITGLSAGGAMTAAMLAAYPELFAGGAVIAGLPFGVAASVPEAFDRMRGHGAPAIAELQARLRAASPHAGPWPTLSAWHGSMDNTVAASNMDLTVGQWRAVHGVAEAPSSEELVDGHLRRAWRDSQGREVIESYTVAGMSHGTPLRAGGEDGLGTAGPFMLEAGISSTLRIARFWGIAGGSPGRRETRPREEAPPPAIGSEGAPVRKPRMFQDVTTAPPERIAPGVQKTIEDALRRAGLLD